MTPAAFVDYAINSLRCHGGPLHMGTLVSIVFSHFYGADAPAQRDALLTVLDLHLWQRSDVFFEDSVFSYVSCDPCQHPDCVIRRVHGS